MAEILNFNKNQNEDQDDFANDPGLQQFMYILEMPDELFNAAYPMMKEELVKSFKSGEFIDSVKSSMTDGMTVEDAKKTFIDFGKLVEDEEMKKQLSVSKLDFIKTISEEAIRALNGFTYRDMVDVSIELCHANAKVPAYANPTDGGADVYAVEDATICPGETKILPTGFKMAVPDGWIVSVRPRSGMSVKTKLRIANAPGTIDAGYRDQVGIIMENIGDTNCSIKTGDRIAQLLIEQSPMMRLTVVDDVSVIGQNRGGGFGHTGN